MDDLVIDQADTLPELSKGIQALYSRADELSGRLTDPRADKHVALTKAICEAMTILGQVAAKEGYNLLALWGVYVETFDNPEADAMIEHCLRNVRRHRAESSPLPPKG